MQSVRRIWFFAAAFVWLAAAATAAHAQTLVYLVSYTNTPASFRAKYANGIFPIHPKTPQEQIAISRRTIRNEIWAVSLKDGKRTRLFSDEGTNFELTPAVDMGHSPFAKGSAYLRGMERTLKKVPQQSIPIVHETPQGVYEVSLDGSNRFRRLADATQNMSVAMVNAAGTRAAFYGWEDKGGYFLYVYELPSANLLTRANITTVLQARCGNCQPETSGWMADGKRLFFTLEEGDVDDEPDSATVAPGVYILSEDGKNLGMLPVHAGQMNLPGYRRETSIAPYLIAQLRDGSYVFRDYALKKNAPMKPPIELQPLLVFTGPDFQTRKVAPIEKLRASSFELSPDGHFLAFVEDRQLPSYKTERHIWTLNLQTGEETELFIVPPPNLPNSPTPNESAFLLGWLEN